MNSVRPVRFHAGILFDNVDGKSEKIVRNAMKGGLTG
jgi:hypothetical protein